MSRILFTSLLALGLLTLATPAFGQGAYESIDRFTACPYTLGAGTAAQQVYVGITETKHFDVDALKKEVTKIAQGIKKGKDKPQCALKDGAWKLQKTNPEEVQLFWWFNASKQSYGWVAAKKIEDRVFILKSNAGKAWVNASEVHDKSSFKVATVGGVPHKLKILIKFAKPGDVDPGTKLTLGAGYDYYYAIKIMTK
jgi:hypothetical protein